MDHSPSWEADSAIASQISSILCYPNIRHPFDIFPTRCNITQFIYFRKTALHVSGGIFTHHQEHTTVFAVSGTCQTVMLHPAIVEELELV